jgi:hypothetical protein
MSVEWGHCLERITFLVSSPTFTADLQPNSNNCQCTYRLRVRSYICFCSITEHDLCKKSAIPFSLKLRRPIHSTCPPSLTAAWAIELAHSILFHVPPLGRFDSDTQGSHPILTPFSLHLVVIQRSYVFTAMVGPDPLKCHDRWNRDCSNDWIWSQMLMTSYIYFISGIVKIQIEDSQWQLKIWESKN